MGRHQPIGSQQQQIRSHNELRARDLGRIGELVADMNRQLLVTLNSMARICPEETSLRLGIQDMGLITQLADLTASDILMMTTEATPIAEIRFKVENIKTPKKDEIYRPQEQGITALASSLKNMISALPKADFPELEPMVSDPPPYSAKPDLELVEKPSQGQAKLDIDETCQEFSLAPSSGR